MKTVKVKKERKPRNRFMRFTVAELSVVRIAFRLFERRQQEADANRFGDYDGDVFRLQMIGFLSEELAEARNAGMNEEAKASEKGKKKKR